MKVRILAVLGYTIVYNQFYHDNNEIRSMGVSAEQVIGQYKKAYQRLYNRTPQYLYILDDDWVVVNGARMRATELQYVVQRLNEEYMQEKKKKQSVVQRLISWLRN